MMTFLRENALELIALLSFFALLLLCLRAWHRRGRAERLEKDRCGYFKYHKDTQFQLKQAYAQQLADKSDRKKRKKDSEEEQQSIAVLEFDGDLRAKQHDSFARLLDEVVLNADRFEEVVVKIESPGGGVPQYGHVFAEMERLRKLAQGPQITVCVDVVAASGGYLAALPAHKIIAAPFAILGSIGVVAFVPNIRGLLQRHEIQPRTFTAGKLKRTVSLTDDASEEELAHFRAQLEAIHRLFLEKARQYRPQLAFDLIETGDAWTAAESLEREIGLVDELRSSQEYLLERNRERDLLLISAKKGLFDEGIFRIGMKIVDGLERRFARVLGSAF